MEPVPLDNSERRLGWNPNNANCTLWRSFGNGDVGVPPQPTSFVADTGEGRLGGFIAVEHRLIIEYGERAEIAALVVDEETRCGGVGRTLVAAAERWATELGLHDMVVRSNAVRAESHPF